MPALPPVANVIMLRVSGTTPVHHWSNVYHWGYTGSIPLPVDMGTFATAMGDIYGGTFAPLMATGSTVDQVDSLDLSSDVGAAGLAVVNATGGGGVARLPASAAVEIRKVTNRHYRGGHPRSELFMGVDGDIQDASHWTDAFIANVQTAVNALAVAMDGLVGTGTTLAGEVFVSYVSKAANPVAPHRRPVPLAFPILARTAQTRIGSARRRIGR